MITLTGSSEYWSVWSCFSCVQLFVIPRTGAHQARLSMGFSRQEYWSGLPCPPPAGSSQPRDWTRVSYISCAGSQVLYHWLGGQNKVDWDDASKNAWNTAHAWKTLDPVHLSWTQFLRLSMPQRLHLKESKLYGANHVHLVCCNSCNPLLNPVT